MFALIGWIIFGLIAGVIAKAIMPGKDPGGVLITIILGIVGSIIGGFVGRALCAGETKETHHGGPLVVRRCILDADRFLVLDPRRYSRAAYYSR